MNQENYLINYYKKNNPVLDKFKIKKRLIVRILILFVCAVLYFLMIAFSSVNKFKGESEITLSEALLPLKIIMIITTLIAIGGLLIGIYNFLAPKRKIDIPYKWKNKLFLFLDWFSILPICVVVTYFCFSYLFIITPVSGISMEPTINDKEHVFVSYNHKITRGSVVILEVNPNDNLDIDEKSYYIKRIIGLPGDEVKWIDNKLYINGTEQIEDYFEGGHFNGDDPRIFTGNFQYKKNGNIEYTTIIPEGYYFVLGDNRSISKDSRAIGLIPQENIIGTALYHMNFIIPKGKIK